MSQSPETDEDGGGDDNLLASFASRLEEEGGATNVALRSEAQRAASALRDETQKAGENLNKALDWDGKQAKRSFPDSTPGILEVAQWRSLLVFGGLTVALALFAAATTDFGDEDAAAMDAKYAAQFESRYQ